VPTTKHQEHDVAVVGAGTMGSMLAMVFAAGGHAVALTDTDDDVLADSLPRISEAADVWLTSQHVVARITPQPELEPAVRHARFVIEAATEDLRMKQQLFADLERFAPRDAILCSNTSALPIREVTALVDKQERVAGTHWFNPPHLVPAVEVIRGPRTSDATVTSLMEWLKGLDKVPVEVKDVPGFLANRLQMALVKEAMLCVSDGVATAEDVDRLFTHSIGFRLAAAGPLAVADFAGLPIYSRVFDTLAEEFSERFEAPSILTELVAEGRTGTASGAGFLEYGDRSAALVEARDRRLLALARLQASSDWNGDGSE
jgi:3-hydroxyacyl-CoA dehydrogenase